MPRKAKGTPLGDGGIDAMPFTYGESPAGPVFLPPDWLLRSIPTFDRKCVISIYSDAIQVVCPALGVDIIVHADADMDYFVASNPALPWATVVRGVLNYARDNRKKPVTTWSEHDRQRYQVASRALRAELDRRAQLGQEPSDGSADGRDTASMDHTGLPAWDEGGTD